MEELTDRSKMPFGKWVGHFMAEVPADYLDWLHGELAKNKFLGNPQRQVLNYILKNRKTINAELNRDREEE